MRIQFVVALGVVALAGCDSGGGNKPPAFASAMVSVPVDENTTGDVFVASAQDPNGGPLTYQITGGADAGAFTLTDSGNLQFVTSPDFEAPADAGLDNSYEIVIEVSDVPGATDTQTVIVAVNDVNEAPMVTSAGQASVDENSTLVVYQAQGTDPENDSLTFDIAGGADAGVFAITPAGALSFASAQDFESPNDADADNVYVVDIVANDGSIASAPVSVAVTVADVAFAIDGLAVGPGTDPVSVVLNWNAIEAPSTFDSFAVTYADDAGSTAVDLVTGVSGNTAAAPLSLVTADLSNGVLRVEGRDGSGNALATSVPFQLDGNLDPAAIIGYFKAGNTDDFDSFGWSIALSADGSTMAVGAIGESSQLSGDPLDNSQTSAGAVYIFERVGLEWQQQAYLKPTTIDGGDRFGNAVALSNDGNTLVVGADLEDSGAAGVNGNALDNGMPNSGAAYVFVRSGAIWSQQAYLKSSAGNPNDVFGKSVAISGDGSHVVIGASSASPSSGSAFVFSQQTGNWLLEDTLTPSNGDAGDIFGFSVAITDDGTRIAVGAPQEDSGSNVVNGADGNDSGNAGAVYIFEDVGTGNWQQQAYVKAPNTDGNDLFGYALAFSEDGTRLATSAVWEGSNPSLGPADNSIFRTGAGYLFENTGSGWQSIAMFKEPQQKTTDYYGSSVALSADGIVFAMGAPRRRATQSSKPVAPDPSKVNTEQIAATGNVAIFKGTLAVFRESASGWDYDRNLSAPTDAAQPEQLGSAIAMTDDGTMIAAGVRGEAGTATGVNGAQNEDGEDAGAVFLY
ncbi:MAG: Ig-like domain-containing protein [Pseudomonadota bacterium]